MQLVKKVSLDINKKVYQEIKAKQNDIGRFIEFTLFSDGISLNITGNTVKIYGNKPDGKIIFNNLTILDYAKGIVLAELTNQALAKPGTLEAELVIYGSDGTEISSIPFGISIGKSVRNDSAIESENEFTALSEAMQNLAEYEEYKQMVEELGLEKLDKDGDSKDNTVTFAIAETETDIASGEKHNTLFGKIAKSISTFRSAIGVLASLSTVNKTNLVEAINELATGKIDKNKIINTLAVTEAGFLADALLVKKNAEDIAATNNNLATLKANYGLVSKGTVTTQSELDAIINNTNGYLANSIYEYAVNCGTGLSLGGGMQVIRGYKYTNDFYGWQKATVYSLSGIVIKYRSKVNGTWTEWA